MKIYSINNISNNTAIKRKSVSFGQTGSDVVAKNEPNSNLEEKNSSIFVGSFEENILRKTEGIMVALFMNVAALIGLSVLMLKSKNNKHSSSDYIVPAFESLKDNLDIPILSECNSIDKKLKSILSKHIELNKPDNPNSNKQANRIILYGPPGVGKTFFTKVYAKTLGFDYMEVRFSDFNSKWAGEGVEKMQAVFDNIKNNADSNPSKKFVVVFDEMEASIPPLEKMNNNTTLSGHIVSKIEERDTFINNIDILTDKCPNVIIIGTTNSNPKEGLDKAVLSRFKQNMVEVTFPNESNLSEALTSLLKKYNKLDELLKNDKNAAANFAKELSMRKCSYRDMNVVISNALEQYDIDLIKNPSQKFNSDYLKKALKEIEYTDGELSK